MTMSLTGLIITIVVIALGIYDLVVVFVRGTGSTISDWMIRCGFKSPMVVFTCGFICGHLFGYMEVPEVAPPSVAMAGEEPPAPGITAKGTVYNVVDGDTVDMEVKIRLRVRILDLWCPERRAPGGPEATARMRELVQDKEVTIFAPARDRLDKSFTFGRPLVRMWVGETDVAGVMIDEGFGTREKP